MPSLCIPFIEGDKVVLLRGSHISVGRFPDNTIQIEDRTVSGYHFELHFERDHYRLHDRGSTNGVLINGRRVEDFHLREESQILVGTVLCAFHPGNPMSARAESVELLPVREEVQSARLECRQLKEQNAILREQIERMLADRKGTSALSLDQLAEANAKLQMDLLTQREEMDSLASRLTLLVRDRDNLQRAYTDIKTLLGQGGDTSNREIALVSPPLARNLGDNQTQKLGR
jgi:pSer/pThr/pTyr-binding forkhead associated (FHA) protein